MDADQRNENQRLREAKAAASVRRLPAPWTVEATPSGFRVRDANGNSLAFVYGEDHIGRRQSQGLLTMDEARRVATAIARLPELLGRPTAKVP